MSVFRFTSAWDSAQQANLAKSAAERAGEKARSAAEEVAALRGQVDRLQMVCEAMWTVVKRHSGLEDAELARLVEEIDLRDGRLDGRSARAARSCGKCGRVVSVRTSVCIYCGAQNEREGVF